ncbi:MAG TPA: CPBP family intramembrane glutamic endopeptidase [Terriglobales bacterium]|nr:CPBP family intramembrane glutamic endopeptidase [Terriglobales bacterium]
MDSFDNPQGGPPEAVGQQIAPESQISRPAPHPDPWRENPPWTFADVIRILLVAVIALVILGAAIIPIAARRLGVPASSAQITENPRIALPVQALAYLAVLAFMVVILYTRRRPFWESVQWNFPGSRWLAYLLMGMVLGFLIEGASAFLPVPKEVPFDKYFTDATGAYLMAIFGITLAPLMEELFFRGFLYPVLNRRLGLAASLIITALAFSLLHAAQLAHAWAPLFLIFIVGLVLTYARARTHSVASSFLIHAGYNSTLFVLMWFATDHFRHLEKMT